MSSGGLNHLYSNEDTIFFLNPQITYFKSVYRKHTKFSSIDEKISSIGNSNNYGDGDVINYNFPNHGELISGISLNITKKNENTIINGGSLNATYIPNNIGTALFDEINIRHDDRQDVIEGLKSEYINFQSSLNNNRSTNATYDITSDGELVCNDGNNYQNMALTGGVINTKYNSGSWGIEFKKINALVPIPFSITKNSGTALPVFIVGPDRSKFNIEIKKPKNLDTLFKTTGSLDILKEFNFTLIFRCIYLSPSEKRRLLFSPQEYLIEKVKYFDSNNNNLKNSNIQNIKSLANNLPLKAIYIVNNNPNYRDFSYQLKIGTLTIQDLLPHEFYSKINIMENFKGCVYKHQNVNGTFSSDKFTTVDNRIAYMPLSLKNEEGPSGCIDTSTNQLSLIISPDNTTDNDIDLYLVYYSIYILSDNRLSFPYGNI